MIFVIYNTQFILAPYDVHYYTIQISDCIDFMYSQRLGADIVYVKFDVLCISSHCILKLQKTVTLIC